MRIHPAGWSFIISFAVATLVLYWLSDVLGFIGLVVTVWCIWFFRDPDRQPPADPLAVISPADGRVQAVVRAMPPEELGMGPQERTRVSVFLNIFNVHVNRVPASGRITALHYRPGKFINASLDKASVDNERQSARMTTAQGHDLAFVQIAGLIARRIICTLKVGQEVTVGERYGLIRFGSRADIYLPEGTVVAVKVGDKVVAGESILARLPAPAAGEGTPQ